ncbi:beta-ketoacyl [acyl carrier protein] synthase domain-containing protein [Archangium lansingense]|uniref:Polyketide synthase n=1 Tax=Archangium lansingense TaxID=2995310 RepID=A0ABT4AG05_9BACT|nr:polyketide synthase [Archangium lansinium]MCY1080600.1 polyketide synthase [Archangium lansinium]
MTGPIAIVAAACRMPDADSREAFWDNLIAERVSLRPPPVDRWPDHPDARVGAFLEDVRGFDAAFFGMSGGEAEVTDPQQRLLLETAHEALERAGFAGPRRRNRRVGVFVGVGQSDYQEGILRLLWSGVSVHPSAAVGNLRNLIPARVAHSMDLSGPALAVDTACSSSLVALHLACESLNRGECELALAGGITLNLTPTVFTVLARWCRTASSCRGRAACASRRCPRPRKVRWSDCCGWCVTGCCAFWTKEGPSSPKGPRTRGRRTRRTRYSSGCAGRRWTSGLLPVSSPGAPSWRASPCMPTRTFTRTTGRGWVRYA